MNVFLGTLGCRLNEAELETWSRSLAGGGHRVVGTPEDADLLVVNTCAVTAEAGRKSRRFIGSVHRRNPGAKLVVTGCYSQLDPERAAAQQGVDLIVANPDKERLVELVHQRLDLTAVSRAAEEPSGHHAFRDSRTRAFVKVQDGCRNRCTFCIVTIARGAERSRTVDDVVAEIEVLENRGYQEAVLTGVHLGGYGSDLGTDLTALVRAILERARIPRLRLSSLEPWDLPADFGALWDDPRLMPHLHLPLQSGSDAVLRRMARRCSTAAYRELVARLRAQVPDLAITTDVIVGFPGETDAEHAESLAFARDIGFAHMHVFSYSRRDGTTAARMSGHLPGDVKRERSRQMHELAQAMTRDQLERVSGSERAVLWERSGVVDGDERVYEGYTDNYLRTVVRVPRAAPSLANRITRGPVEVSQDGTHLVARAPAITLP